MQLDPGKTVANKNRCPGTDLPWNSVFSAVKNILNKTQPLKDRPLPPKSQTLTRLKVLNRIRKTQRSLARPGSKLDGT